MKYLWIFLHGIVFCFLCILGLEKKTEKPVIETIRDGAKNLKHKFNAAKPE